MSQQPTPPPPRATQLRGTGRPRTARERARAELVGEIKELALRQLQERGTDLSLRAIARELGMVSSALYRYFRSRDELLTALIVDAYDELADTLAHADGAVPRERFADRWVAVSTALRRWAQGQPHRFTLVYGSPVPGYRAPADTVAPAERVMRAFSRVVQDAAAAGPEGLGDTSNLPPVLEQQLRGVAELLAPAVPPATTARMVAAFGQVVGMVGLELAGHFVGGFEPADELFGHTVREQAAALGLAATG